MQRTRASRSAQSRFAHRKRLARAADADLGRHEAMAENSDLCRYRLRLLAAKHSSSRYARLAFRRDARRQSWRAYLSHPHFSNRATM